VPAPIAQSLRTLLPGWARDARQWFPFGVDRGGNYFFVDCSSAKGSESFYRFNTNAEDPLLRLGIGVKKLWTHLEARFRDETEVQRIAEHLPGASAYDPTVAAPGAKHRLNRSFCAFLVPRLCTEGGTKRDGAGSNGSDLSKRFRGFCG